MYINRVIVRPDFFKIIPDTPPGSRETAQSIDSPCNSNRSDIMWYAWIQGYFGPGLKFRPKSREQFCCRRKNVKYVVTSESIIRSVLIRVNPRSLDNALQLWNKVYSVEDESLTIDGKVMCNAIDKNGKQTHIMSVIGRNSKSCYTKKK